MSVCLLGDSNYCECGARCLFFLKSERGHSQQSIQKTMKLPPDIATPLLVSLGAIQPIRRIEMSHREMACKSLTVGRTFVVQEGYIRIIHTENDACNNSYDLIGSGGMFGDLPFALNKPRQGQQAMANGSTCLLEFSRTALEKEAECNQEFNRTLMRAYGAFLGFGEQRLRWRLTNPLARRAALVLTDLLCFGAQPCPHGRGYLIPIRMTQGEFADLLGVARQTLNSLMKEWQRQGMVSYTRTRFCICNLEELQKIVL